MEVVVELLRDVFGLEEERAMDEMMRVHHAGHATIAELPVEVARPKLERARELARGRGYPLWIRANPI
jgi:ATP-dependent Clp protease adapter protein ClpS